MNRATDVDSVVEIFTHTMKQQFTNFVPSFHPRPKPVWSNRRLRELKRQRAAALRNYVRRRNAMTKLSFTTASRHYKTYNRFLYAQHVLRTQSQLKRNPKRFWSFVNSKRKESGLPSSMFLVNDSVDTLDGIGSLFRKHFSSIFNSSSANTAQIQSALRDVPHNVVNLSNICFSDEDVLKATEKLKPSSSAGPDGIPAIILKRCAIALCVPLRIIFNKSLSLGVFPDCWKKSAMFPVYKKGNKHDIVNYRGITSLSAGSKLFEILVGNVLSREFKPYMSTAQHGFYPGRSTTTNLLEFSSHCMKNIEKGLQVDTIYTDLKAAFDRVDHNILLAKIERLGASHHFTKWLKSYLVDRTLFIKLGNTESDSFVNLSGVPQGSNLGPLLFNLFFNDVCYVIPPGSKLIYADDLKLFRIIRSTADCKELQRYLDEFSNWCTRNLLIISVSKCSVISFTRKLEPLPWNYSISGETLERVSVIKDLGVLLDSQLFFKHHYSHIIVQANKNLGFMMRIAKELTDPFCLLSLYISLVRSILETSAIIWSPYTDIWTNRIESVQAKFLRFALRSLPWRDPVQLPPYASRCRLLGIDTLAKRRDVFRAVFVGKLLTGEIDAPNILSEININVPYRNLRMRNFLRLSFHRTEYGQNEPIRAICDVFNNVFDSFDFNVSSVTFKNRFKRIL